jgi:dienelactone hydrolase
MFHEIHLPGKPDSARIVPAHGGKLWVYLPAGEHAPKSLGCVLIAGAGSNLVTGMDLGDGDRPEHLPYVKAGYAVVAYELDGKAPENAVGPVMLPYIRAFTNAQGGLLNARVAIEYATTRVAAIDPGRLYAAGHSSAGTIALLVAENEPRLAACLAYAPAADLGLQYPPDFQREINQLVPGASELFTRFNPRSNEAKIKCPVFLFYAQDDARFAEQVRALGERLTAAGKAVTVESSPTGGHYESMIETGVPRGIAWLKSRPR